uniref:CSC1/OSCA1-like 7TM region domain-containing protein n=1 Tax=Oryza nivara TaxID=4536 RepID=A0A0E0GIB6_ORYNI
MKISGLLTSAGINIALSVLFISLYSVLRKQPANVRVYFGRRIAEEHNRLREAFILERFVPSTGWIVKALQCTEEEILAAAGLDAVVFNRILVFSLRIFSLAAILCVFGILPLNYFGQDIHHVRIPSESLDIFTIGNVKEYKHIARLRLRHLTCAMPNPSHFTVLVRGIPKETKESCSNAIDDFFTKYHGSSYLFHQVVYKVGKVQKIMTGAKKAYRKFKHFTDSTIDQRCRAISYRCCLCGASSNSFQLLATGLEQNQGKSDLQDSSLKLDDQLEQLQQRLPFLKGILEKKYMSQLVTGYLPSVILQIFLYAVAPIMILFSTLEGPISHSERKRSACCKVLYFTVWNIFFGNVLSGTVISQLNVLSSPKDIPVQLARAIPVQATFFITYVLTSGWASLSSELMQLFGLIWNFVRKYILRMPEDTEFVPSFPYHTEVPKVLLFGLLGFTCSVLAPLILPFLLVYFFLGYIVYRNQLLNVYRTRYDTGGLYWPIAHNAVIFSLVLTQIICLGVFGLKESPVAAGFTIPLIILTLLFNQYCRNRLLPLFRTTPAQDLIDMDREDERSGRMDEIHHRLHSAYCQFHDTEDIPLEKIQTVGSDEEQGCSSDKSNGKESFEEPRAELSHPTLNGLPVSRLRHAVKSITFLVRLQKRGLSE